MNEHKCEWCIGFVGTEPKLCNQPAKFVDKVGHPTYLCQEHAEAFAQTFGFECLKELDNE